MPGAALVSDRAAPARPAAPADDRAARNAALNATHSMGDLRARGGVVVRSIEERRRRLVASRVLAARPRVVVDVGCEDGWIAEAYAARVGETVLVDLDPAMLERAAARRLPRTRCVVADATRPDALPRRAADVLVLSAVLEHLEDPGGALEALSAGVRDGGRVVVFVPADGPILAIKSVLRRTGLSAFVRGVSMDAAPGHLRRFDRGSLARLLRRAGEVVEVRFDPLVLGYVAVARVRS
jgi:SAM-dependent methyltransferase